jgi:bla regulator protein blaR1
MSGVSGSDLKKGIVRIMTRQISPKLDFNKGLLLSKVEAVVLSLPLAFGFVHVAQLHAQTADGALQGASNAVKGMRSNIPRSQAQSQTGPKASFDVISIKKAADCRDREWPLYRPGGRYKSCGNLKFLIFEAYNMKPYTQLDGIPKWSDDAYYRIEAKAEGNPSEEQMHLMVRSMLEDRFKLKMHNQKREARVYSLVIAKGGHKLRPAKDEHGIPMTTLPSSEETEGKQTSGKSKSIDELIKSMPPGSIIAGSNRGESGLFGKAMKMKDFADMLSSPAGIPVIDRTGLMALYDINLKYAHPNLNPANSPAPPEEPSAPDIFRALQDQLGLKLELGKELVDHFIIESAGRPPEN